MIVGFVKSTLMPLTVADAELPALSVTVRDTDCAAPSPNGAVSYGHGPSAMPDSGSLHVNTACGAPVPILNQPVGAGAILRLPEISGAVLSIMNRTCVAVL